MHPTTEPPKARWIPRLVLLTSILIAAVALAACGSSSSSSSSSTSSEPAESEPAEAETTSAETEETAGTEGSGGSQETTVYAKGVPTLAELYEGSEEEPPTSGPKAVPGKYIAVVSCGLEIEGCLNGTERFLEAAKVIGWKTKTFNGKANVNDGYATAIRSALASQPDAIALLGINCPEVKTSVEEIASAGIPIASYAGEDCGTGSEEFWSFPQLYNKNAKNSIESYEEYGEFQAAFLIDATEGKAKILSVGDAVGFGLALQNGQKRVLEKCAECEVLENLEFESTEVAPGGNLYTRFETVLTKYPEANSVLIPFDSLAAGGMAKVIVDSGRSGELTVVSGEGNKETLRLIREEAGLNAEGAASSFGWTAWGLVDNLNRYLAGQPVVAPGNGYVSITKDKNMQPAGQSYETPVDYKSAYERIWSGK